MPKLTTVLPPHHRLYQEAIQALRRYHQAQCGGASPWEVERLRLLAESAFQAVTDYQLRAFGKPSRNVH